MTARAPAASSGPFGSTLISRWGAFRDLVHGSAAVRRQCVLSRVTGVWQAGR